MADAVKVRALWASGEWAPPSLQKQELKRKKTGQEDLPAILQACALMPLYWEHVHPKIEETWGAIGKLEVIEKWRVLAEVQVCLIRSASRLARRAALVPRVLVA